MKKSPAFQFYPNDWLSSPTTQIMTAEQEGAYIRLLCFCWQDDDISLRDDDDYLSALSRISKGGLTVVKAAFNQHPTKHGYLTHNRLLLEYEKQKAWRDKSSQGGKKSVESKRNFKGGSRVVQPKVNQDPTLLSSSSSSSSYKERVTNVTLKKVFVLPDWIDASVWSDYCEMRARLKKPLTERAKDLVLIDLQKLKEAGDNPNDVLNQSVKNSWQGVFALKQKTNQYQNNRPTPMPSKNLVVNSPEWKIEMGIV